MSLIEQLGGYERVKPHLITSDRHLGYTHVYLNSNGRYCFLDDYVDYIPDCAIRIKFALEALLQYRRQHRIFEVGDDVACSEFVSIGKFVRSVGKTNKFCAISYGLGDLTVLIDSIRHATDAEIKAGKRLDYLRLERSKKNKVVVLAT